MAAGRVDRIQRRVVEHADAREAWWPEFRGQNSFDKPGFGACGCAF
jgi:hypothetical protein